MIIKNLLLNLLIHAPRRKNIVTALENEPFSNLFTINSNCLNSSILYIWKSCADSALHVEFASVYDRPPIGGTANERQRSSFHGIQPDRQ